MSSTGLSREQEERRRVRNPKGGRPRIEEQLGDPMLALKAQDLRGKGLSWTKIAARLGIGRSTARTLCLKSAHAQVGEFPRLEDDDASRDDAQFRNSSETVSGSSQEEVEDAESKLSRRDLSPSGRADGNPRTGDEEDEGLPRTFRLFSTLLERARMDVSRRSSPEIESETSKTLSVGNRVKE